MNVRHGSDVDGDNSGDGDGGVMMAMVVMVVTMMAMKVMEGTENKMRDEDHMINLMDDYYFSKKFSALRAHGWLGGDFFLNFF